METEINENTIHYNGKKISELTDREKVELIVYLAMKGQKYEQLYFDQIQITGLGIIK